MKIAALVLIAAGIFALAYKTFSYTEKTHETKVGPIEVEVREKETVTIPTWAGIAAIVGGAALLLVSKKRA
jgi:LPXTG-motif cell wall-anchored protein